MAGISRKLVNLMECKNHYYLICDLWQNGKDSVNDMRVVNTDAKYHIYKAPEKCLLEAESGKKRMYLEACLLQRRHF